MTGKVQLRYFASLRETHGIGYEIVSLPAAIHTCEYSISAFKPDAPYWKYEPASRGARWVSQEDVTQSEYLSPLLQN